MKGRHAGRTTRPVERGKAGAGRLRRYGAGQFLHGRKEGRAVARSQSRVYPALVLEARREAGTTAPEREFVAGMALPSLEDAPNAGRMPGGGALPPAPGQG